MTMMVVLRAPSRTRHAMKFVLYEHFCTKKFNLTSFFFYFYQVAWFQFVLVACQTRYFLKRQNKFDIFMVK